MVRSLALDRCFVNTFLSFDVIELLKSYTSIFANSVIPSFSQTMFGNHFNAGDDIKEQFEPSFVKLDKQVSRYAV